MLKPKTAPPQAGAGELARVLRLLGGAGAYAVEEGDGAVVRRADGGDRLDVAVKPADWRRILGEGLVVRDGTTGTCRLSRVGRERLRRMLSTHKQEQTEKKSRRGRAVRAETGEGGGKPGFNARESPLAWLYRRKDKNGEPLISPVQFAAGERLRVDFERAQLSPRVTASWDPGATISRGRRSAPGTGIEPHDAVIAASERVKRALAAVGPELSGIVLDVCCFLSGLEEVERKGGYAPRSGKHLLQIALSVLARHYGLDPAGWKHGEGRIRHWGSEGYRPVIEPDADGGADEED